ncbi:MAG: hypothetical protein M3R65_09510 [Gemmatimonadota bacterium]|nr:hypothetical protein [Gemmatimonadota bacterium]
MKSEGLSLVVANVRLETGMATRPWATAFGIRDGRLAVLGTAAEILKMAGDECDRVDARGQSMSLPAGVSVGAAVSVSVADGKVSIHPAETPNEA